MPDRPTMKLESGTVQQVAMWCSCCKRIVVVIEQGLVEISFGIVCRDCSSDHANLWAPYECPYREDPS